MRGLAVGIALTMYGRLEEADSLIDILSKDKDPILRRAAMHTLALAYCGTGNNQAVRKLLHVAVSHIKIQIKWFHVFGFLIIYDSERTREMHAWYYRSIQIIVEIGITIFFD